MSFQAPVPHVYVAIKIDEMISFQLKQLISNTKGIHLFLL